MSRHMVPVMLGLAVFPLAAVGVAAYVLAAPAAGPGFITAAVFLLASGMIMAGLLIAVSLARHESILTAQHSALTDVAAKTMAAAARLAALEERATQPSPRPAPQEDITAEMGALRRQVRDLMQNPRAPAPRPERPKPAPPQAHAAPAARDELTLWLEPVVDLAAGVTSHYRALIGLTGDNGKTVSHDDVMRKADHSGLRPSLDARLLRMVAPVLRRLRLRNPDLRIIVPVGRLTLGAREEAARLLQLLRGDPDLADGIVLEFAQQDLGRLDAVGIDNLARLARAGTPLALREVFAGGLDLSALRHLGVCYLSFPPHAADAGSGPSAAWTALVESARSLRIDLVIDGIETQQQAAAATRFARFGKGPFFAPPRRVRHDAGVGPAATRNASAA